MNTLEYSKKVNTSLTKFEAIDAMRSGYWVQHRFFDDNEMVSMKGPNIIDENGIESPEVTFWKYRSESAWDNDWLLLSEVSVEKRKRF